MELKIKIGHPVQGFRGVLSFLVIVDQKIQIESPQKMLCPLRIMGTTGH